MPNEIASIDKAVRLSHLQTAYNEIRDATYTRDEVDERTVQFTETANPASAEVIDEYARLTSQLYQALEDTSQLIGPAQTATTQANTAAAAATTAAGNATTAANAASSAATAASAAADSAAEAAALVDSALGGRETFAESLAALKMQVVETTDPTTLLS